MSKELNKDEVATLIQARKILNSRGLSKDIDVKSICESAGISRKTGYQWADKLESAVKGNSVEDSLLQEIERLKAKNVELEKCCDDLEFENEGRKLAWEIHGVEEFIANKKKLIYSPKRRKE